uniref:Myc protein n=1 Tax=Cacopsylla melanoneura TaxID=428564 RepID=A0A8D8LR98_9HEMI
MLSMEMLSEVDWMFDLDTSDIHSGSTVVAAAVPSSLPTANMDAIPTDDIWNKFDFGIETSEEDDGIFEPSSNVSSSSFELYWAPKEQFKEIRHHDCMWAGLCGSKDHKNADSCILAYEDAKPAPLSHIKSNASDSCCNKSGTKSSSSCSGDSENTISRTTLTNGTQITTVFKNRTNSSATLSSSVPTSCSSASSCKTTASGVAGSVSVKVSIVDKKSSLSSLKHLCSSNDSLSNDTDVHLMPLSEVTGQITRTLSTIESNPPIVDFDCANRDHNYGMVAPPPPPVKSSLEIKREPVDIKQELSEDDDEDYDSCSSSTTRNGSSTVYMSPSSSTCSGGSKFDYGVQQVMSKYIKTEDLGVQTPSDSDEEVDVVSLYDIDLYENCKRPPTLITPPQSVLTSRATTPNYQHSQPSSVTKLLGQSSSRSAAKRLIKSTLPTNPYDNLDTYEELQRNVAKVIKKSTNSKKGKRKSAKKKSKKSSSCNSASTYLNKNQTKLSNNYRANNTTLIQSNNNKRNYEEYKKQYMSEMKTDVKKKKQYRIDLLPEKRKFHNNMERKRRVDLRNLFEELRELIPNLQNKKRAPKVQILNEAETLCNELSYKSKMQSKQAEELRREQARLRNAVGPLRQLFYEKNVSYLNH